MPTPTGTGRWQSGLLAQLDGVPAEANELVRQMLGREPTRSEYNAASVAVHNMARLGLVKLTRQLRGTGGGAGPPRVFVLKIGAWIQDGDGAVAADDGALLPGWITQVTDAAWEAFGQDPAYCEEMCATALKLMTRAERAALGARQAGDEDGGTAAEARQLRVVDVGVKVRYLSDFDGLSAGEDEPLIEPVE